MPNAATFDDDLAFGRDSGKPARNASRKRPSAGAGRKKKGKRPRIDMHRVARVAAIGMASTMAVGIMVNALMLQKGHHPAPLFAQIPVVAAKPGVAARPGVAAPVRAETAAAIAPAVLAPQPKKANVAHAAEDRPAASDDAISRLLAGGTGGSAKAAGAKDGGAKNTGANGAGADARTVTNVQRALTKLGFKVPPTGTAGPATRKAIEAYEKERHLPVNGEVDRRLVKALAAEAKTKLD